MAKKKEEPIANDETGKIKVKAKKEKQPDGNETKGNVTKVKEKMKMKPIVEEQTVTKLDLSKPQETEKEDRKDKRTKIQASQQSELIDQRSNNKPPKNFESSGNDILGGIDLSEFGPR